MLAPPIPDDEDVRLAAIERFQLRDTGRESVFDKVTDLAVRAFNVPISMVSIVGASDQFFKGAHGLSVARTSRQVSFCGHAILEDHVMVIEDALEDERFATNPLVTGAPGIRFYAGAPLRLKDGLVPGALCLIDRQPRSLSSAECDELSRMARLVVEIIELRLERFAADERGAALARLQDEFLATSSHELRTPITSVLGALGLLRVRSSETLDDQENRLLNIAHANAKRLGKLVNDILDFSKLSSGTVGFNVEPISAATLIAEAVETNATFASTYGVDLVALDTDAELKLLADEHRLMQVMANLISNAVKFSPREAKVTVGAQMHQNRVRLTVSDRGAGIPVEFQTRLFERFSQANASDDRVKGGTGLGLAIVREIVSALHGEVAVESKLGAGTSFHVDLPLAPAPG